MLRQRWVILLTLLMISGCGAATTDGDPADAGTDTGVPTVECSEPLVACGDTCVDLLSDPEHCGACDKRCAWSAPCVGGCCQVECPLSTLIACCGICTTMESDPLNCGACGRECASDEICDDRQCVEAEGRDRGNGVDGHEDWPASPLSGEHMP